MKSFLKENFVLVLGVSLPALLVITVMLLQSATKLKIEPPQYAVLFANDHYYYSKKVYDFDFDTGGKMSITYHEDKNIEQRHKDANLDLTLIYYDPRSNEMKQYELKKPKDYKAGTTVDIDVPEDLAEMTFNTDLTSPDGYTFGRRPYRSGGGLFTDIFGYRSYRNHHALLKDGAVHSIPDAPYSYYNSEFIGWVNHE